MVHALRGWGNGRIVPRGPLREEPRALLKRADVVALHRFPRPVETETETDEGRNARAFAEALERDVRALLDPKLGVKTHERDGLRTRNRAQTWSMVSGQPAVGEKNAQAPSRAARQAGRGAPARRRPRNGQHLPGPRSDGRRRAHAWRRHQPRGTRARAAAAHPAARSRNPTCGGRWRCRRTPPRARRGRPRLAPVSLSSRVDG